MATIIQAVSAAFMVELAVSCAKAGVPSASRIAALIGAAIFAARRARAPHHHSSACGAFCAPASLPVAVMN
ncbi:hypothetical protein MTX20_11120 [Bradyrhizobium sp. ISRA435]|nr:hypothetical protein MTX20_11120 [Bradyrhizobium sp. ISRA435]